MEAYHPPGTAVLLPPVFRWWDGHELVGGTELRPQGLGSVLALPRTSRVSSGRSPRHTPTSNSSAENEGLAMLGAHTQVLFLRRHSPVDSTKNQFTSV